MNPNALLADVDADFAPGQLSEKALELERRARELYALEGAELLRGKKMSILGGGGAASKQPVAADGAAAPAPQ